MQERMRLKAKRRAIKFKPLAYEAEILNDRDYLLHLPNGETACVMFDDTEGPTLHVIMWPGDRKTFIDAKNRYPYLDAEKLR